MTPEDPDIDALLESVASRERIDWPKAEARAATGEQRSRLRAVRDVELVAEFHRSLQRDVTPDAARREVERWGDLLLLERVGSGTSGEVYRAWDPALQREVALKLLRTGDGGTREVGDWLEEARALARVRDTHVASVYGAGENDGRVGLWMEFLHGPTLEAQVAHRGPLPPDEVARLGIQLGRALAAVHAAGALHRDVKPANVILEHDGRAVLMDFGLGQRTAAGRGDRGAFSGTPMFMSPQRLAGAPAQAADDLYALAATLRFALTGALPLRARTIDELREALAAGPLSPVRSARADAPEALASVIDRALLPDPSARFANAAALIAALEAAAAEPAMPGRTRAGLWLAVVLALVVAITFIAFTRMPHRESARLPAAAATPAAPALPAAYDVSASLLRHGVNGDARLESGDRVAPGDPLSLEFNSSRPVWVYVLDADERGESYLLFPQPMFDRKNPVPGGSSLILPGTIGGRDNAWTVTSRGGREHFLIVASPEPVAELEAELSHLPAPQPGRKVSYARVGPVAMDRLRGVGGVTEIPQRASPPGTSGLFEHIRALAGREQGVHGTWVRQIVLQNPLR
jgi:RIO-like serine/threonine protein kinase